MKPLLWLWYSFDRLPIGGQNVDLGVRLRRLLAPHIFKRCGERCGERIKAFQHVEFSCGYNIECGDDVVVHRHVLLDDRDGVSPGVRFKDAELLGMPMIVIAGRGVAKGVLEVRDRIAGTTSEMPIADVARHVIAASA